MAFTLRLLPRKLSNKLEKMNNNIFYTTPSKELSDAVLSRISKNRSYEIIGVENYNEFLAYRIRVNNNIGEIREIAFVNAINSLMISFQIAYISISCLEQRKNFFVNDELLLLITNYDFYIKKVSQDFFRKIPLQKEFILEISFKHVKSRLYNTTVLFKEVGTEKLLANCSFRFFLSRKAKDKMAA